MHLHFFSFHYWQWGFYSGLLMGQLLLCQGWVGKLRHWHCNDFRFCCGFRIACETGYSLTEGGGSHVGFLWTVMYLPHLFPASPPWFLLVSDIVLTSNILESKCGIIARTAVPTRAAAKTRYQNWIVPVKPIFIFNLLLGEPVADRVFGWEWCHELKGDTVLSSG